MPPSGYLSATGIESAVVHITTTYPSICQLIVLPEPSIEGRIIRAFKIGSGSAADRPGVLFTGGVHARELINPDTVVSLGLKLCRAYTRGRGLKFGGKSYSASMIKSLVHAVDIIMLPLVNPDGRVHVQSPTGYEMWRKNRNPNPGLPCMGVDLNRNFDFLWSTGIGTSSDSCSDTFKGSAPFSEPETRNVRYLLETYHNIGYFMDIHSYSELVLYPWGDDENQTTDPAMNFRNPAYDGLRGTPGDTVYREHLPAADLDWFVSTGSRLRDAMAIVRGRLYTIQQSIGLYPTSATSDDYVYSRNSADASRRKVFGFTLETAREFQPAYAEALDVMAESSVAILELCLTLVAGRERAAGRRPVVQASGRRADRSRRRGRRKP